MGANCIKLAPMGARGEGGVRIEQQETEETEGLQRQHQLVKSELVNQ